VPPRLGVAAQVSVVAGIDYWFQPQPPAAGTSAPGSFGVKQGVLAAVRVALVVWIIMPHHTRLLHGWLFAGSSRRERGQRKGTDL
jgi:hypothetical protein